MAGNKKEKFTGKFIRDFITQKKTFKIGEKFSTESKKVYEYLINNKIIK